MKRYEKYKKTNCNYLGSIPKTWDLKLGLSCFEEIKQKNSNCDVTTLLQFKYGKIVRKKNQTILPEDFDVLKKYSVVNADNIVINGLNLNYDFISQRVGRVEEKGIITSAYITIKCRNAIHPKYANYLLKSLDAQKIFHGMGSGVRLTLGFPEFSHMYLPVPPRAEQDQIVRYLDWKVSRINKLIHAYQREIKLLEERKLVVINNAVTGQINVATMKRYEKYKNSEILWLKSIPNHWKITRLKHVLNKQERLVSTQCLLICSNHGYVKPRGDDRIGLIASNEEIYQGVQKGDLLIHGMDTWHGAIAVSSYDGMCTPVVHVCTSYENVYYIALYMQLMAAHKVFKLISNGVRQNTSDFRSWDKAGTIELLLPPRTEQDQIVTYLDAKCAQIETLKSKMQRKIELLTEYRTRLISDVVTGQIDVRDVVIPNYEVEEEVIEADDDVNGEEVCDGDEC